MQHETAQLSSPLVVQRTGGQPPPGRRGAAAPATALENHHDVLAELQRCLEAAGLDLVQPFTAQQYNQATAHIDANRHQPLPTYGRQCTAAAVIGNTRSLWPIFVDHLARHPEGLASDAPLDDYVSNCVEEAVSSVVCKNGLQYHLRLASDTGPLFGDMLRAAAASGLAYLDPNLHLCVHPRYGPWIALRAVLVWDADGEAHGRMAQPLANPFPALEPELRERTEALIAAGGFADWRAHWQEWVGIRRLAGSLADPASCYSDAQIRYHYMKEKGVLEAEVAAAKAANG